MRVALYARVSDDKLKDDGDRRQDIQRQVEKIQKWVNAGGQQIALEDIYLDDGKSAFKDDYQSRPAFVKLLREIRGHHYQRVYVEDLTRWARRVEDGLKTLREAAESGCTVTSLQEGEADVTTATGWFKCGVCFLLAEWASRSMAEKISSGMRRRTTLCEFCKVVHLGRHPLTCQCKKCKRRK